MSGRTTAAWLVAWIVSAVALVFTSAAAALAGTTHRSTGGELAECLGLSCPNATAPVPEAGGPMPSLAGTSQFAELTTAGFYEYGLLNPDWRQRAVAFVVPPGQADQMPRSIRRLRVVQDLLRDTTSFSDGSTVFIVDRDVFGAVPAAELAARAARTKRARKSARRRMIADASGVATNCPNNYFCIYDFQNQLGERWGLYGIGTGWLSLSACCNNFNDQAESMQSYRERDSLLNRTNPPSGGAYRYCADSNSYDFDFDNNFGGDGNNVASMWANTDSDQQC